MKKIIISTNLAPDPVGAYNQAIVCNGFIFTSGQIPIDPESGFMIEGDFKKRVNRVLLNIEAVLTAGGSDLSKSVKLTVFLTDLSKYTRVNEVFDSHFKKSEAPARSLVEVSNLPGNADVEIECIALI